MTEASACVSLVGLVTISGGHCCWCANHRGPRQHRSVVSNKRPPRLPRSAGLSVVPFNSCPWSSELDFPQIVCNFHPIWSNVGLHCCRANHTRSWLGILVGLLSRCPQGWLPCAQRLTQALVWLNIYSPAGTLRLPDLGWCQTVCVWLHTRLLNCLYYQHLRSMRPQGEPETQVPNGETRVSTTNTETPTTHRTTSTSSSKESVLYDGVYSVRWRQSNILHHRQCK